LNTELLADIIWIPLLYGVPILVSCGLFVTCLLVALEVGYRVGLSKRKQLKDGEAGGGAIVLNSIFALLSLILAFTYGFTINRYDQRRQSVVNEANALGSAFLRAELFSGPDGLALREALYQYAKTRVADT
jgi:hypothetical protein